MVMDQRKRNCSLKYKREIKKKSVKILKKRTSREPQLHLYFCFQLIFFFLRLCISLSLRKITYLFFF